MSGQVGSQIKIGSGQRWLLANVRKLKVTDAEAGHITAEIDFLGEGDEDRARPAGWSTSSAASPAIPSPAARPIRSRARI